MGFGRHVQSVRSSMEPADLGIARTARRASAPAANRGTLHVNEEAPSVGDGLPASPAEACAETISAEDGSVIVTATSLAGVAPAFVISTCQVASLPKITAAGPVVSTRS